MDDLRVPLANLMAKNNVVAQLYPHQKRLLVMMGEINQTEGNGITDLTRRISGHHGSGGVFQAAESARIGCRSVSNSSGHRLASRSCCRSRMASFRAARCSA